MRVPFRRRLQVLAVLLLVLASTALHLPGAPKADAALHNLFPADVDGFPKGNFRADDAMFIDLTSDFNGGKVCVVDASVTDPASANCENPRWADAQTYVGLGTLTGVPFAGGLHKLLRVGTWKLLATDTAGKNGNELSEPFTVVTCTPTCDTTAADSQLKPWKDRASQALPTKKAQELALAVDIATRTYSIMSSAYTGLSFGLGAAIFAGGWTAVGFGQIVPGTEDIAKALYAKFRVTVSQMWAGIAADPPDPNFATVAQPVFQTLASTGDTLHDDLADALMREAAYGDASRIANERYQGAVAAGDHAAAAMQAEASANFTYDMIGQLRREKTLQPQIAALGWANEPIVQPPAGQDAATWWTNEIDGIAALTPADLSASDRQFLKDHDPDITDAQIDAAVAKWSDPNWIAQMRSVNPSQTIADTMNADTALIPDTITTLDAFGRWMSLNAADEQAKVPVPPTNHKPVSSFNADKLTGTAPLTVTFNSTATDPDGDALSLHWDIAGTDSADGVTSVTHTFTTPGTYGVSLVATDPAGAWDQAVKWITVYPDGVDPGSTNNPPVAQFTPQIVDASGPITQTFTSTSFDPDGDPLTQTWYFGDGTTATGASVTKTFPPGYIMSVLLVVSDGDLTGQAAGQVTSRDSGGPDPGQPPTASFTADPSSGTSPLAVNFTSTSSDPDGDPLTETWYFGDGGTATGPTATHTYTAAGSYTATLVVSDGTNSHSTTRPIVVNAVTPIKAAYTISRSHDAAALAEGARVLDTGVSQLSGHPVTDAFGPSSYWLSANGDTGGQEIIVRLAGNGSDLLDHVVLQGANTTTSTKTFSVALSQSNDPFGTYTTVIDHATLPRDSAQHAFAFAKQTARFVKLTVHDNYGNSSYVRLDRFSAPTSGADGGIVSLGAGPPATIESVTSEYNTTTWAAKNILSPNASSWSSANGQVTDQRIRVRLGGAGTHDISSIVLRSSGNSYTVSDFQVYASTTGADGSWTKVLDDTMAANNSAQTFTLTSPTAAKFLELRLNGTGSYLYLSELRALTSFGLNVADGAGVGAQIVDSSPVYNSNTTADHAIAPDSDTGRWLATGSTDKSFTVLLKDEAIATIDHVSLFATQYRAKDVHVQVSTDGVTFTTVAQRTLDDVSDVQAIYFPPTQARFVKLVVDDGYATNYVGVSKFRVYSIGTGSGAAVPFVDTSTGTSPVTSWQWDFGDGTTSTEQYPTHTFPGPGTYPITLTVTDSGGASDTTVGSYTVPGVPGIGLTTSATELPDGSATIGEGTNVSLTAADDGSGEPVVAWEWDLDYTQPSSTGATVTAKFPDQGTYVVRFRGLTADWVWTPWATKTFVVTNIAPSVDAGAQISGLAGDPLTPGSSVSDPAGTADPLTCTWDWGDGTAIETITDCTSNRTRTSHTFAAAGTYTATLTADDGDGGVTADTTTFVVAKRPTFLQITDASVSGNDLHVTVRLLDQPTFTAVPGAELAISADGSTPVSAVTTGDGSVSVTLPGTVASTNVSATYAGSPRNVASTITRPRRVPKADIMFMVDESGSMGGIQRAIGDNLRTIAGGLTTSLDFRLGLVGYANRDLLGVVHQGLDQDLQRFNTSVDGLTAGYGNANGYEAILTASDYRFRNGVFSETNLVGLQPPAASCAVLVTNGPVSEADVPHQLDGPDQPSRRLRPGTRGVAEPEHDAVLDHLERPGHQGRLWHGTWSCRPNRWRLVGCRRLQPGPLGRAGCAHDQVHHQGQDAEPVGRGRRADRAGGTRRRRHLDGDRHQHLRDRHPRRHHVRDVARRGRLRLGLRRRHLRCDNPHGHLADRRSGCRHRRGAHDRHQGALL